jgi:hypothetical protein
MFDSEKKSPRNNVFGWDRIKTALLCYKQLHGHFKVPARFVVPEEGDDNTAEGWPKETHGMKLGKVVGRIKYSDNYRSHRSDLIQMGFDNLRNTVPATKNSATKPTTEAITTVAASRPKRAVPPKAPIVDSSSDDGDSEDEDEDEACEDASHELAAAKKIKSKKRAVKVSGKPKPKKPNSWDRTKAALLRYKEVYGDLNVLPQFVVPSEQGAGWPEETRGKKQTNQPTSTSLVLC